MPELLVDRAGRRRSPATMPGFRAGRPPGNKGEIIETVHARRVPMIAVSASRRL